MEMAHLETCLLIDFIQGSIMSSYDACIALFTLQTRLPAYVYWLGFMLCIGLLSLSFWWVGKALLIDNSINNKNKQNLFKTKISAL